MDFNLNEEQRILRDSAARLVAERYPFTARRKLAETALGFDAANWATYAELGWLALELPEELGGLGCSFVETLVLLEEFGRGMVLEPYLASAVLCARIVERSGAQAHRAALLPRLAEGKLQLALADAESDARFDIGHAQAMARRSGEGYVLDGFKLMALGAASADRLIVSARVDGEERFALFLVDPQAPGVSIHPYILIDRTRAADIELKSVAIGESDLLIGTGRAPEVLEEALDRATLALVAQMLGMMETVLDVTIEHLKTRVQFGQPIGRFQALQHRVAEMFVEVQETRSILLRGLAYIDSSPSERRAAVSAAKAYAGQAGKFVGQQGIQLHGGMGITEECQVGQLYRCLFAAEKLFGDTEYHSARFAS